MFPYYTFLMLGLESSSVIKRRFSKIGRGGSGAVDETFLMFAEKANAFIDVSFTLAEGGTIAAVIDSYRARVAANEARLASSAA